MNSFVVQFITILTNILYIAMIGRVIMSWLNLTPSSPLYSIKAIIFQITEPVLGPIRRVMPRFGMFDFSPMIAIFLIALVRKILVSLAG